MTIRPANRLGSAAAPITIIEFSDFQCPFCAKVEKEAEGDADEQLFGATLDVTHVVQGNTAALTLPGTINRGIYKNPSALMDLTGEDRFGEGDYIATAVYGAAANQDVEIIFVDSSVNVRAMLYQDLPAGWSYLATKRSDMVGSVSFDWSRVDFFGVLRVQGAGGIYPPPGVDNVWLDDVRISRADPDNAGTFNDTGRWWNFDSGVWHIYQDVPEVA